MGRRTTVGKSRQKPTKVNKHALPKAPGPGSVGGGVCKLQITVSEAFARCIPMPIEGNLSLD